MRRILAPLGGFVIWFVPLLIVFAVVNGVLVGGQKLWHRKDEQHLTYLRQLLAAETDTVEHIRADMQDMEQRQIPQVLARNDARLKRITAFVYRGYAAQESVHVERHDALVDSVNALARKVAVWYVIPIPGRPGGHVE